MKVYQSIAAVAAAIAKTGIAKDRRNEQQGYRFRGIDDVLNALSPLLAAHQLVILPRVISRVVTERQTAKGGALFSVVLDVEFDFINAEDGSKHTVRTYGEAMDSADKATNKAMSAAYKYAAFLTFCIPVEGALDEADATTPETAPKVAAAAQSHPQTGAAVGDPVFEETLTRPEQHMIFRVSRENGWTDSEVTHFLRDEYNVEASKDIPRSKLGAILDTLRSGRQFEVPR